MFIVPQVLTRFVFGLGLMSIPPLCVVAPVLPTLPRTTLLLSKVGVASNLYSWDDIDVRHSRITYTGDDGVSPGLGSGRRVRFRLPFNWEVSEGNPFWSTGIVWQLALPLIGHFLFFSTCFAQVMETKYLYLGETITDFHEMTFELRHPGATFASLQR